MSKINKSLILINKLAFLVLVFLFIFSPFQGVMSSGLYVNNKYKQEISESRLRVNGDSTTGAFIYNHPIVTPPGRNGLEPNLQLIIMRMLVMMHGNFLLHAQHLPKTLGKLEQANT